MTTVYRLDYIGPNHPEAVLDGWDQSQGECNVKPFEPQPLYYMPDDDMTLDASDEDAEWWLEDDEDDDLEDPFDDDFDELFDDLDDDDDLDDEDLDDLFGDFDDDDDDDDDLLFS